MADLTPRQREALSHVAHGMSIDQTADTMGVTRSTVEKLLAGAKQRLNARTVTEAVYRAVKTGLILWCCVMIYQTGEMRRNVRPRRREQYEFLMASGVSQTI